MRAWAILAAMTMTGCVVYAQDGSDWSSSSSSTSTDGPGQSRHGQLAVTWQVGGSGCEAAGVETIEVDFGGLIGTFPCLDGSATMDAPTNSEKLVLHGLDVDGFTRYEGDGGRVNVHANGVTNAPTVVLAALPVTISATWYFDNGHLCGSNGVDTVELDLFDADDTLQAADELSCDDGEATLDPVKAGVYSLLVLGRAPNGVAVYAGQSQVDVLPGDHATLDVMLAPQ